MPRVEMTPHLYRFFPQLEGREIQVPAGTVAEVLRAVDQIAPGFADYIVDERGVLRPHVLLCIDELVVLDRKSLSERVPEDGKLYIFQALTGG